MGLVTMRRSIRVSFSIPSGINQNSPGPRRGSLAAKNPLAEWVFESHRRDGSKAPANQIKTAWRRALRLGRIEGFRFHDLRHTFASHFAMRRGDLYALAKILGHSNPKITLDRYAHLSPEFVHAQRSIMDRMYTKTGADRQQMDSVRNSQRVSRS